MPKNKEKKVPTGKKKTKSKGSSLSSRIRGIKRLLQKDDLPEEVRKIKKLEYKELMKQKGKHEKSEKERKMALKYRKVKFFERRKLSRKIQSVQNKLKQLESLGDSTDTNNEKEKSDLNAELQGLMNDLNYIKYYPKDTPYIALFPNNGPLSSSAIQKQQEIKVKIAQQIADGTLKDSDTLEEAYDSPSEEEEKDQQQEDEDIAATDPFFASED